MEEVFNFTFVPDPNSPVPSGVLVRDVPKKSSGKLYEQCPGCKGTRTTQAGMMVDGWVKPDEQTGELESYSGAYPAGNPCPLCDRTGFIETGMTVGQLEMMRAKAEKFAEAVRLIRRCGKLLDNCGSFILGMSRDISPETIKEFRDTITDVADMIVLTSPSRQNPANPPKYGS